MSTRAEEVNWTQAKRKLVPLKLLYAVAEKGITLIFLTKTTNKLLNVLGECCESIHAKVLLATYALVGQVLEQM